MSISLQNHLNAVAPAMGMIGMSYEIHYDEGEEENFEESWALVFAELRSKKVPLIGYVLTVFEEGFIESVGKTVVLYAQDIEAAQHIKTAMDSIDMDVVAKSELGIKYGRGIEPHFFGLARFTELVVNELNSQGA